MTVLSREEISLRAQEASQEDIAALLTNALRQLRIQERRIKLLEDELTTIQETTEEERTERAAEAERRRRRRNPLPLQVGDAVQVVVTHRLRGGQIGVIQKITSAQYKVYNEVTKETFHIYKHNVLRSQDDRE